jgi:hypothetical protein
MQRISLTHLPNPVILRDFKALLATDRFTTVQLLAYIAEMDLRRMYLEAGYSTMAEYCVGEFDMSEGVAYRRIRAAQAARRFPVLLDAVEDGRLHLAAVGLLDRHLTRETVDNLVAAAAHRSKRQVEKLIAERFPRPDVPEFVRAIPAAAPVSPPAEPGVFANTPQPLKSMISGGMGPPALAILGPVTPGEPAPSVAPNPAPQMGPLPARAKISPRSALSYAAQFNMSQAMHDQLRYAQALLGHSVPSGDVARVFALALDALVDRLERRRFAKTSLKGPSPGSTNPRYIPAEVRRAVWQRDSGRCTFVGSGGKRCDAQDSVEFDHVVPVARGGEPTVANVRLCCRAHNQYEAERVLGVRFMQGKRDAARARSQSAATHVQSQDLVQRLRQLGLTPEQAARAAARCTNYSGMPVEERLTLALRGLAPACVRITPPAASSPA